MSWKGAVTLLSDPPSQPSSPNLAQQEDALKAKAVNPVPARIIASPPEPDLAPQTALNAEALLTIQVKWQDDGTAAAGIHLIAMPSTKDRLLAQQRTVTDEAGTARLALNAGSWTIVPDRGLHRLQVDVSVGESQTAELLIPAGAHLEGIVVDEFERAIVGAKIWLSIARGESGVLTMGNEVTTTDAHGRFQVDHVSRGQLVSAVAPEYVRPPCQVVDGNPGQRVVKTLRLVSDGRRVRGVVVDTKGAPIANASIQVGRTSHTASGFVSEWHPPAALAWSDQQGGVRGGRIASFERDPARAVGAGTGVCNDDRTRRCQRPTIDEPASRVASWCDGDWHRGGPRRAR